MNLARTPTTFLVIPAIWLSAYWAAWHFNFSSLFFWLAMPSLLVPVSLGWAMALRLQRAADSRDQPHRQWLVLPAALLALIAYLSCLYASGSVFGLIPEAYKFGNTSAYLSRSTVQMWAAITAAALFAALALLRLSQSRSPANALLRTSAGMLLFAALFMIGLLVSGHVTFRA